MYHDTELQLVGPQYQVLREQIHFLRQTIKQQVRENEHGIVLLVGMATYTCPLRRSQLPHFAYV